MNSTRIMTPEHPRWDEFVSRLSHATICFKTTENARLALASIPGIDAEESLTALAELGGACDCQIVFFVGRIPERAGA
jgi:hypothetical protein